MHQYICKDRYHSVSYLRSLVLPFALSAILAITGQIFINYTLIIFGVITSTVSVGMLLPYFMKRKVDVIFDSSSVGFFENGVCKYNVPTSEIDTIEIYRDGFIIHASDGEVIQEKDVFSFHAQSAIEALRSCCKGKIEDHSKGYIDPPG